MADEMNQPNPPSAQNQMWGPVQVVVMSAVCLVVGLVVGYLLRGSAPTASVPGVPTEQSASAPAGMPGAAPQQMPSLDDMKRMADKKAEPLLAKLKTDPGNAETLNQLGILYKATHQFKEAEGYYQKALEVDPKNVNVRTDLASCLYFTGDIDGAIAELKKTLTYDPKHAGALMNLGIIEYKSKNDASDAVASWEKLLKLHPDFPQKDLVQHMIEQAKHPQQTPQSMGITKE